MTKPLPTSMRLDPVLKAALQKAALADGRSLANLIDRVLRGWLIDKGHLPRSADKSDLSDKKPS